MFLPEDTGRGPEYRQTNSGRHFYVSAMCVLVGVLIGFVVGGLPLFHDHIEANFSSGAYSVLLRTSLN